MNREFDKNCFDIYKWVKFAIIIFAWVGAIFVMIFPRFKFYKINLYYGLIIYFWV